MTNGDTNIHSMDRRLTRLEAQVEERFRAIDADRKAAREAVMSEIASMRLVLKGMSENNVDRMEFLPIRNLVWGVVGSVMMAVVGAIMALVLTRH